MRFTERELTVALEGAAKAVLGTPGKWDALSKYQRFQLLDGLGDQLLPVLVGLPDVEVAAGTRPTFTDAQIRDAVSAHVTDVGRLRRRAVVDARVVLTRTALAALPPRADPDALVVPDHL